jgi:hypothetical protein
MVSTQSGPHFAFENLEKNIHQRRKELVQNLTKKRKPQIHKFIEYDKHQYIVMQYK